MLLQILNKLIYVNYNNKNKNNVILLIEIINFKMTNFLFKINFLNLFYERNYNIWNDGFLIDFAQKKSIDLWVRKTVILTQFLFSDRYLFELITRVYNNNLLSILNYYSSFEVENTISMLSQIIFYFIILLTFFFLFFVFIL